MKHKASRITKILLVVIIFLALCSLISYIIQYPNEAWKAVYGGIGAFVLYCIIGYFKDRWKQ